MFPSTVLIHEAEHCRRHESHIEGCHTSITTSLWEGDQPIERSFDQSANDVFSRVISFGFYTELLKRYKKKGLVK